ncbi:MAG: hypothetical protein LRY35_02195 [Clostridiales bacterium]|nr:hypothetical protein [Clostridiales bacterium]
MRLSPADFLRTVAELASGAALKAPALVDVIETPGQMKVCATHSARPRLTCATVSMAAVSSSVA